MTGDQTDMMQKMMPMMMGMHARMMDHGDRPGMAMMDRGMMQMMMGPGMMGVPSAEEATAAMQARLSEFDADGDGSLSLSEFETLHSAMIRESMVDRFQHLDADGDGTVSPSEMVAPAGRMSMRERMSAMSTDNSDN
jgi:Ca2+-binding EF-hand superfamily protein